MSESKKTITQGKMPYVIEFVRFFIGFTVIIITALAVLRVVAVAASA